MMKYHPIKLFNVQKLKYKPLTHTLIVCTPLHTIIPHSAFMISVINRQKPLHLFQILFPIQYFMLYSS